MELTDEERRLKVAAVNAKWEAICAGLTLLTMGLIGSVLVLGFKTVQYVLAL